MKNREHILIVFVIVISFPIHLNSQCFPTSWHSGTQFSVDNSIGDYNFSTPENAAVSDNTRASAASLISILTGDTHYLVVTGFNFNIPSYASICGVTVEVESRATGLLLTAAVRDNEVRLVKNGVIGGDNKALAGDWGNTDTYRSYGSATDLWGLTLSPADVNDPGFGVAFSARIIALIAALPSADIDHIRVKIDYNPVLPITIAFFEATRTGNEARLKWMTTDEEPGSRIRLQRKTDQMPWQNIREYELDGTLQQRVFNATDTMPEGSSCQYRLQTILISGNISYSVTRTLQNITKPGLRAYPNPASHQISISNTQFEIRDQSGKLLRLPAIRKSGVSLVDISQIPPGIYMVSDGSQSTRFIRQ